MTPAYALQLQALCADLLADPVLFVLRVHAAYVCLGRDGQAILHALQRQQHEGDRRRTLAPGHAHEGSSGSSGSSSAVGGRDGGGQGLDGQLLPGTLPLSVPLFVRLVRLFGVGVAGGLCDALAARHPGTLAVARAMPLLVLPTRPGDEVGRGGGAAR